MPSTQPNGEVRTMKNVPLPIAGRARSLRSIQMAKQFYRPEEAEITILKLIP